ncbi:hypothetical protein GE09DRAFT_1153811 [Coniochaeta sp. 2T2.1]|nr:hypothetical protein GE09DRAFT_1153811 [Coniochaeta sp. 2T2.1]
MTEKQWEDVRKVPKRCRDTSPGEQWKVIFSKLFGDNVPVPPPYLPSLDQYRRIATTPPQELLSALEIRILNSGQTVPFHVEQNSLRVCLGLLVPALFDLVSEHGLLPSSSAPMPIPQQFPQPTMFFSEGNLDGLAPQHDHDFHDEAERLLALADTW